MAIPRGAVVIADDPYIENSSRPQLIINSYDHPFHGSQYISITLSRQQYDDGILLESDFFEVECPGLRHESYAIPWSVNTLMSAEISKTVAYLEKSVVDAIVEELRFYITAEEPTEEESIPASTEQTMKSVQVKTHE